MSEHIIFNNINGYDEEAVKDYLLETMQTPEESINNFLKDEEWLSKTVCMLEEMDFQDELINLNTELETDILVIADLGLWNGRHMGYKNLGNNLANILTVFGSDCDYVKIWVEGRKTFGKGIHHDGTHYAEFRKWKPTVTEQQKEKLLNAIYFEFDDIDILKRRFTSNIADDIRKIYGF